MAVRPTDKFPFAKHLPMISIKGESISTKQGGSNSVLDLREVRKFSMEKIRKFSIQFTDFQSLGKVQFTDFQSRNIERMADIPPDEVVAEHLPMSQFTDFQSLILFVHKKPTLTRNIKRMAGRPPDKFLCAEHLPMIYTNGESLSTKRGVSNSVQFTDLQSRNIEWLADHQISFLFSKHLSMIFINGESLRTK